MWFAKWFRGRTEETDTDEPARVAAPNVSRPPTPATVMPPRAAKGPARKGFDPYNSGSFERRNAWERVNRR
jgi:hypothetical protein